MEEKLILGKHNIKILREVFKYCGHYDVDCHRHAGIFDTRRAAIAIWSRPWRILQDKKLSVMVGTIYVDWDTGEVSVLEKSSEPAVKKVFLFLFHNVIRNPRELSNPYSLFYKHLSVAEKELSMTVPGGVLQNQNRIDFTEKREAA